MAFAFYWHPRPNAQPVPPLMSNAWKLTVASNEEALNPASGTAGLDEEVQSVSVGVPSGRSGANEGRREGLLGMAAFRFRLTRILYILFIHVHIAVKSGAGHLRVKPGTLMAYREQGQVPVPSPSFFVCLGGPSCAFVDNPFFLLCQASNFPSQERAGFAETRAWQDAS